MYKDLVYAMDDNTFLKIYNESSSYEKFSLKLGFKNKAGKRSRQRIRDRLISLGISDIKFKSNKLSDTSKKNIIVANKKRVKKEKRFCAICGKEISYKSKNGLCQACYRLEHDKLLIKNWKVTGNTGCTINTTLRNGIRRYIYKKQNNCCAICGMINEWNNQPINFILDHIDGDASNNFEDNLRLICPNCDSQLPTYKSKNKNSTRSNKRHN